MDKDAEAGCEIPKCEMRHAINEPAQSFPKNSLYAPLPSDNTPRFLSPPCSLGESPRLARRCSMHNANKEGKRWRGDHKRIIQVDPLAPLDTPGLGIRRTWWSGTARKQGNMHSGWCLSYPRILLIPPPPKMGLVPISLSHPPPFPILPRPPRQGSCYSQPASPPAAPYSHSPSPHSPPASPPAPPRWDRWNKAPGTPPRRRTPSCCPCTACCTCPPARRPPCSATWCCSSTPGRTPRPRTAAPASAPSRTRRRIRRSWRFCWCRIRRRRGGGRWWLPCSSLC